MKIMFICTGNICRSAMAHAMLEQMAQQQNKQIEVYSCGLFAQNKNKATKEAIEVLDTIYNVNLKKHRATNIENSNIEEMDLILCATTSHKNNIINEYPALRQKVYTIKEFAQYPENDLEINDPWGCNYATYKRCAGEINECLNIIIKKI